MGFWGITMSESDYGLDMLEAIVGIPLKDTDFLLLTWRTNMKLSERTLWKKSDRPIADTPHRT